MASEKQGLCKLCLEEKELRRSHIFPRSYFRSLKTDGGQLTSIVVDEDTRSRKSNSDPKEYLLCQDCELFLSESYEQYGTRLFKDQNKGFTGNPNSVTYSDFKYKTFYLYLISILWRASVSTLDVFSIVEFPAVFNEILRQSVHDKKIKISDDIRLDEFIKIGILKVVDKSKQIKQDVIDRAFIYINLEIGKGFRDEVLFYFMVDGHLIGYHMSVVRSVKELKSIRIAGQLKNKTSITIPKVCFSELKQIHESFAAAQKKFEV